MDDEYFSAEAGGPQFYDSDLYSYYLTTILSCNYFCEITASQESSASSLYYQQLKIQQQIYQFYQSESSCHGIQKIMTSQFTNTASTADYQSILPPTFKA